MIIFQNLITANHRKNGESKYDRELAEIAVVTTRIRYRVNEVYDYGLVFLPNPPIAILELPNCLSHEWLTFLKRCYWLVRQEYNNHVTMKVLISA